MERPRGAGGQRSVRGRISGHVQGVGFRWFVLQAARRLELCGSVRNLRDGRVELEAQGPPDAVERLLVAARRGPAGARVDALEVDDVEPDPDRTEFSILR